MKITKITPIMVNTTGWRNYLYVRVDTDEGIHGVGESFCVGADESWYKMVQYLETMLIGMDPLDREKIQQFIVNISRFPGGLVLGAAKSSIDCALWDIAGKVAGLPVYKLIGQVRDKVPCYTHLHAGRYPAKSDPMFAVEMAQQKIEKCGYKAAKVQVAEVGYWPAGESERALDKVMSALRTHLGDDFEIGVEMMTRTYSTYQATRYCNILEPYRPMFAEEAIRPERIEEMAEIVKKVNIPIATGEQLMTTVEFGRLLEHRAADILQPEVLIVGGITTMRKIAAMAEVTNHVLMPHNCLSPLHNNINLQFCMCTPNAVMLENEPVTDGPDSELVTVKLKHDSEGYLRPNDEPGWGMDLNYEYIEQNPPKYWARNYPDSPSTTYADGSVHPL